MMIESRALLAEDMKFTGGFKLSRGTIVYIREMEHGWLGMYYEDKGVGHGFALTPDQFSILRSTDIQSEEHIWMPDPPEPPEDVSRRLEMERRRIEARIRRHREEAEELERLMIAALAASASTTGEGEA